jgi:hypothetical protein
MDFPENSQNERRDIAESAPAQARHGVILHSIIGSKNNMPSVEFIIYKI